MTPTDDLDTLSRDLLERAAEVVAHEFRQRAKLKAAELEVAHLREVLGLRDARIASLEAEAAFLRRAVADVGGGLWFAVSPDAVREGTGGA